MKKCRIQERTLQKKQKGSDNRKAKGGWHAQRDWGIVRLPTSWAKNRLP